LKEENEMSPIKIDVACKDLSKVLDCYEWFFDSVVELNNIVVYTNYCNRDIMEIVPTNFYGYDVKLAFTDYLVCGDKYGKVKDSLVLKLLEEDYTE
jgi:hypothetical protein